MGNVLPNKDVTLEEMNSNNELTFDIITEILILQEIINEKILVDELWYNVSLLLENKCWIIHSSRFYSCNEKAILKCFYSYGDNTLAHVEQISNKELNYDKSNLITLVDKTITKRKILKIKRYCDINFNSIEKTNKLEKRKTTVIDFFSDESKLSSKSDINEAANIHSDKKNESKISSKRENVDDRKNKKKHQLEH